MKKIYTLCGNLFKSNILSKQWSIILYNLQTNYGFKIKLISIKKYRFNFLSNKLKYVFKSFYFRQKHQSNEISKCFNK